TGVGPTVNFTGVGGTFTLDAAGGSDTVTVNGTSGSDTIDVVRGSDTTVTVNGFLAVTLPTDSTEALVVLAGLGDDTINVSGSGPRSSDTVVVNGSTGLATVFYLSTGVGSAQLTGLGPIITISGTEHVTYLGQGGDVALTIDTFFIDGTEVLTSGSSVDAGT